VTISANPPTAAPNRQRPMPAPCLHLPRPKMIRQRTRLVNRCGKPRQAGSALPCQRASRVDINHVHSTVSLPTATTAPG